MAPNIEGMDWVELKRATRFASCAMHICSFVLGPLIMPPNEDSSMPVKPGLQLGPCRYPQFVSQQSALLYDDYGWMTNHMTHIRPPPRDDPILSPNKTLTKYICLIKNYPPELTIRVRNINSTAKPIWNSNYHDITPKERNPTTKDTPQDTLQFTALQPP